MHLSYWNAIISRLKLKEAFRASYKVNLNLVVKFALVFITFIMRTSISVITIYCYWANNWGIAFRVQLVNATSTLRWIKLIIHQIFFHSIESYAIHSLNGQQFQKLCDHQMWPGIVNAMLCTYVALGSCPLNSLFTRDQNN